MSAVVMIQPFDPKVAHLRWPFRFHIHQGGTYLLKQKATTMQLGDEISRDLDMNGCEL